MKLGNHKFDLRSWRRVNCPSRHLVNDIIPNAEVRLKVRVYLVCKILSTSFDAISCLDCKAFDSSMLICWRVIRICKYFNKGL